MTRYLFAYNLKAQPNPDRETKHTADEVLEALRESRLGNENGFRAMEFYRDEDSITGETNPDYGSVQEDFGFRDEVAAIAAKFPDYVFEFDEENTEDTAVARHAEYRHGQLYKTGTRRVLEYDEHDQHTVDAVVAFLLDRNHGDAAEAIEKGFK